MGRPREESLSLRISQQKQTKLRDKEKKDWGKKQNRISKSCGTITKGITQVWKIPEGEEKGTEIIQEIKRANNSPKIANSKPEIKDPNNSKQNK